MTDLAMTEPNLCRRRLLLPPSEARFAILEETPLFFLSQPDCSDLAGYRPDRTGTAWVFDPAGGILIKEDRARRPEAVTWREQVRAYLADIDPVETARRSLPDDAQPAFKPRTGRKCWEYYLWYDVPFLLVHDAGYYVSRAFTPGPDQTPVTERARLARLADGDPSALCVTADVFELALGACSKGHDSYTDFYSMIARQRLYTP